MSHDLSIFGLMQPDFRSEINLQGGVGIDPIYLRRYARDHEAFGFDGVLVGASADMADSLQIAAFAAAQTERLKFLIAHRPGPIHPTLAARQFASLDHLTAGRVILHAISSRDGETTREGDTLDKSERYARTAEHLRVLKKAWTSKERFDFEGRYYRFQDFRSEVLSFQQPRIPISFAGDSEAAQVVGTKEADIYSLYAQPLADFDKQIRGLMEKAREAQRERPLEFTLIARLVLGRTEQKAWVRARRILSEVETLSGRSGRANLANKYFDGLPSVGDQRTIELGVGDGRHDRALWAGISAVTGRGNSAALVGTPEVVAEELLRYAELGVNNFILHGFEPYEDVMDYGRTVLPLLRQEWRQRRPRVRPLDQTDGRSDQENPHA
ncbi:LLM class flavin-dependent oxidoreductase [Agrobacterium sp. LAD9]|uniref:LLM class flavin-dependent oxidoreductase n=1 Tax=Agrobacterium sp. LAD9 TaxID=2055153 RepID=UPI000D1E9BEA|nr:LLM class flavin-dependent oxidoreductase [Agrobacterium sp. LAD9]